MIRNGGGWHARRMQNPASWLTTTVLTLVLMHGAAMAQAPRTKPAVPAGIDPGGVAIGLLTTGIDYVLPPVARCLARDGEGQLIGWDVVDRDRLPYRQRAAGENDDSVLASAVDCDGRVRIVPVRVDPGDGVSISRALAFLTTTPARIVVLPLANQPRDWMPFRTAATEFKKLLIVVAAAGDTAQIATDGLANVVVVKSSAADGERAASMMALGRAVMFVACEAKARDSSLDGAALKALFEAQALRTAAVPLGHLLSPKCQ